jgi:hypothetical protein
MAKLAGQSSEGAEHGRQSAMGVVAVVNSQAQLFKVVGASGAVSGFTDSLHCREQQSNQDAHNGDHHQQLDEGKAIRAPTSSRAIHEVASLHLVGGRYKKCSKEAMLWGGEPAKFLPDQTL